MSSALDEACKKVDELILEVGKTHDAVPSPHGSRRSVGRDRNLPSLCTRSAARRPVTHDKPFERNNPMPGQFNETTTRLLKPVIKPGRRLLQGRRGRRGEEGEARQTRGLRQAHPSPRPTRTPSARRAS